MEPTVTERRRERVRAVLADRTESVVPVVEAVRRRHNASAILRSAEAFGLHEVHLVTGRFRVSKGAARGSERWLDLRRFVDVLESIADLRGRGFSVWAADPDPTSCSPETVPVDRPVALVFGSELVGISDEARAACDGTLAIPMRGLTESLNVSVAAACALMRIVDRRRAFVGGPDLSPARQHEFYAAWLAREAEEQAGIAARKALRAPSL